MEKLNLFIDQLQQPFASPKALKHSVAVAEAPASTVSLHSLHLSSPFKHFSGESGDCLPFISQCELHFEFIATSFSSDRAKIVFIISQLTGRARSCAMAEWSYRSAMCNSLPEFVKNFTEIFHSTRFKACWQTNAGDEERCTWWTGRAMGPKSAPGFCPRT